MIIESFSSGVRCAAISSLGRIITECKVREARDKARLTLETIAKDPQGLSQALAISLVSTFAFIAPNCPQNYIEDSKLLCICRMYKISAELLFSLYICAHARTHCFNDKLCMYSCLFLRVILIDCFTP